MATFAARFRDRGGIWLAGQAVLILAVGCLGWFGRDGFALAHSKLLSALMFLVGGMVGLAGFIAMGRNLTPYPVPGSGSSLVTGGIYQFIRHPLYLSVWLVALAWTLRCGSWSAVVASVALGAFFYAKARREESFLVRQFPDYPAYARRVRRFIPGIW